MIGTFRNIYRGCEIILILARYDALFFLNNTRLSFLEKLLKPLRKRSSKNLTNGQKLLVSLQLLGPSFIKLGQALSIRSDLVGEKVADELKALQDRLPPFPFAKAKSIIESDLGPLETLFSHFNETPVAAASIAQVHFAKTIEGDDVAVKILRPNIAAKFARDYELLYFLAGLFDFAAPSLRRLRFKEVILKLEETTTLEMDFSYEAASASEYAENFKGDENIRVPKIYWKYSSSNVMTLEKFEGVRIDDLEALRAQGHDIHDILMKSSLLFVRQVLRDGFFHADMHPGNVLIDKDGKICVIDYGIMGRLDKETRIFLAEMLLAFLNRDYRKVADLHFEFGLISRDQDRDLFAQACRAIAEPILGLPQNQISIARLLNQLFKVFDRFKMVTETKFLLLHKTMFMAEGLGRILNPELNFWEVSRELIEEWGAENLGLRARIKTRINDTLECLDNIKKITKSASYTYTENGLILHPSTIEQLKNKEKRSFWWQIIAIGSIMTLIIQNYN